MDPQMTYFKERLEYWRGKITQYQSECSHGNHVKIAKSDTGNWCPQDDSYWYEITCQDCGKYWHEDQREYMNKMRG